MYDFKKPDDPEATYSREKDESASSDYGASKRRTKPAQYAHWTGDHYPGDFGSPLAEARPGRGRRGPGGAQGPGSHGQGPGQGHGPGQGMGPGRHRRGGSNSGGFGGAYSDQSHSEEGHHPSDEGDERY